jgi:hypothetical protein
VLVSEFEVVGVVGVVEGVGVGATQVTATVTDAAAGR